MRLSMKALAIVGGVLWGGAVFVCGIANALWPPYGAAFLEMAASIYPGYHPSGSIGSILIGTSYAILDGAGCGLLFGWVYNRCLARMGAEESLRITL
ncbi:MAG TPA: hypothetical protein VLM91_06780 [Candidatus Methylomirabilis sp.]|nr:hypothetical protein [Candidatus Methylomirabilis sp.]